MKDATFFIQCNNMHDFFYSSLLFYLLVAFENINHSLARLIKNALLIVIRLFF